MWLLWKEIICRLQNGALNTLCHTKIFVIQLWLNFRFCDFIILTTILLSGFEVHKISKWKEFLIKAWLIKGHGQRLVFILKIWKAKQPITGSYLDFDLSPKWWSCIQKSQNEIVLRDVLLLLIILSRAVIKDIYHPNSMATCIATGIKGICISPFRLK